jgi:hypothetical protein
MKWCTKKWLLFTIGLVFTSFQSKSQTKPLSKNVWLASQVNFKLKNYEIRMDGSYRTMDNYFDQKRTQLLRITGLKKSKHLLYGFGLAYFNHFAPYTQKKQTEIRPFVQFQKEIKLNNYLNLNLRFREEFRYYSESKLWINRSRMLFRFLFRGLKPFLTLQLQSEFFISYRNPVLIEQRHFAGYPIKINSKMELLPNIQLQFQSNVPYPQQILGMNINFKL